MPKGPTARRYAQALFMLASDKQLNDKWLTEIQELNTTLESEEVKSFLSSPRVKKLQKQEIVNQIRVKYDPILVNFIGLLVARNSISLLPAIIREYSDLLDRSLGRIAARVTAAIGLSDQQITKLSEGLSSSLQKEVMIEQSIDTEIIGGVVIRVGDKIIDGSVQTNLESLKLQLLRESIV